MVQLLGLFLFFGLSFSVSAQDERYYRQILKGELPDTGMELKDPPEHQFNVKGASYVIDLNGDGFEESIQPKKRDGVDWLEIKDSSQRKVFEAKLFAVGGESVIYKIKIAQISPTVKLLLLFLDEGKSAGRKFESTARIYLLTMENNDLSTFNITMGPHHYHEKQRQREQYYRRDYAVEIRDVNKDGTRDVIVEYNHIQRIMLYKGKGEWDRF